MIFFWKEFSDKPIILIKSNKNLKKVLIKKDKTKEEIKNDFLKEIILRQEKKKEKVKAHFLGRVVGVNFDTQYVAISTGIKRDGVFKVPKKSFFKNIAPNFTNKTKDELIFYLPFYNEPQREAISKRFMKVSLSDIERRGKTRKIIWERMKESMDQYFPSYLKENKIKREITPLVKDQTKIRIKYKKKQKLKRFERDFSLKISYQIFREKWKNYQFIPEMKERVKSVKGKKNQIELFLVFKSERTLNWLEKRKEYFATVRF